MPMSLPRSACSCLTFGAFLQAFEVVAHRLPERRLDNLGAAFLLGRHLGQIFPRVGAGGEHDGGLGVGCRPQVIRNWRSLLRRRQIEDHPWLNRLKCAVSLSQRDQSFMDSLVQTVDHTGFEQPDEIRVARLLIDEDAAFRQSRAALVSTRSSTTSNRG